MATAEEVTPEDEAVRGEAVARAASRVARDDVAFGGTVPSAFESGAPETDAAFQSSSLRGADETGCASGAPRDTGAEGKLVTDASRGVGTEIAPRNSRATKARARMRAVIGVSSV